jgi:hypothetical protein
MLESVPDNYVISLSVLHCMLEMLEPAEDDIGNNCVDSNTIGLISGTMKDDKGCRVLRSLFRICNQERDGPRDVPTLCQS